MRHVPHLIVDGYNLIHAWKPFKKMLAEYGHAAAQSRLLDLLTPIHDSEGWRITVVFDGNQDRSQIDAPKGSGGITVIYASARMTADGVIERLLCQARLDERVALVSHDGAIVRLAYSLHKEIISSESLDAWLKRISQNGRERLDRHQKSAPKMPGDPAWEPLAELRKRLME